MILREELEIPLPYRSVTRERSKPQASSLFTSVLTFALLFLVVVCLQLASGAYHCEFGGYPDESAHYVTSRMMHDYITSLHWFSPIQFAKDYYYHYPKVAIGHWPPVLYVVQALWMMIFSASRASILLQLALTTAVLGYSVYLEALHWFGRNVTAIVAGLLTVCLPLVQRYTDEEMSETLLALTCFWSAVYFARYMDSGRWQHSFGFGLFFLLAVLTKGSGWLLALMVPATFLLTRKFEFLRRASFWFAIALIGVVTIPWQLFTMRMAEQGWDGGSYPNLGYSVKALGQFLVIAVQVMGFIFAAFAVVGIVTRVLVPFARNRLQAIPAVMLSLMVADWVFHSVVPAGVEDRKLIMSVPALVLFAVAGGLWIADRLHFRGITPGRAGALVAGFAGLCFLGQTFRIPQEKHYGYIEAARFLTSDPNLHGGKILVSSETGGEGMLISEIAMREPHPRYVIIRGTKALAQVDWNASQYRSFVSRPSDILQFLERNQIDNIVVDTFPSEGRFEHDRVLKQAIRATGLFELVRTFPGDNHDGPGQIQLYRFTGKSTT